MMQKQRFGGETRTSRKNLHGREGRFTSFTLASECGKALTNQAPCNKQCIRCCLTNSKDSLYSFARRFLTGTLLRRSSSFSSSFICRFLTGRYSDSRNSCSTSCHCLTFSSRSASLTWLRVRATTLAKSPEPAPLSFHILSKNCVAKTWTFVNFKKNGWKVVEVEYPGANISQCSQSSSTTSIEAFAIGQRLSLGRFNCSRTTFAK